jgi:hypothetical protein
MFLYPKILACFAQRTRIPTSARSTGFCAIWVCISSSSSSKNTQKHQTKTGTGLKKQYTIPPPKKKFCPRADASGGEGLWLRQRHRSGAN